MSSYFNFSDRPIEDLPENYTPFSFRAETSIDVMKFMMKAYERALEVNEEGMCRVSITALRLEQDWGTGEVVGEFYSNIDLETFRNIARSIEDCHVLLQTLRPVRFTENSCERDYDLH